MIRKRWMTVCGALLFLGLLGCGGLRYSEVSPDAWDFHPRRIAALPAHSKTFTEACGEVDRLLAQVLVEKGWYDKVVGGEEIGRRMASDDPLRQVVKDYTAKLTELSFSDPALSARIGDLTDAEALLFVQIDYWNHTTEKDKKVAKVSLTIKGIEAETGTVLWTAAHHKASDYVIIKPELRNVALSLIREIIDQMPH